MSRAGDVPKLGGHTGIGPFWYGERNPTVPPGGARDESSVGRESERGIRTGARGGSLKKHRKSIGGTHDAYRTHAATADTEFMKAGKSSVAIDWKPSERASAGQG